LTRICSAADGHARAISVHDDLAADHARIADGAADHELSGPLMTNVGGIEGPMIGKTACIMSASRISGKRNPIRVLRGDDDPNGLVAGRERHLRLGVGAEPREHPVLTQSLDSVAQPL